MGIPTPRTRPLHGTTRMCSCGRHGDPYPTHTTPTRHNTHGDPYPTHTAPARHNTYVLLWQAWGPLPHAHGPTRSFHDHLVPAAALAPHPRSPRRRDASRPPQPTGMSMDPKLAPLLLGPLLLAALLGAEPLPAAPGTQGGWPQSCPTGVPTQTGVQGRNCPQNWLYHHGYCYGYFTEAKTWANAEAECRRFGPEGRLASIHSLGTSTVLARYVARQPAAGNTWIGLQDEEHTRQWKWSDSSVFDFKRWAPGQPNNLWDQEDCVVLDKASDFKYWHDYPCSYKFPFLCQHQL
ncbi:uncharacterized protein VSU04_014140 [Chlamydotis macqueenii]